MNTINKVVQGLKPYMGKVVIHPLSEEEIAIIQSKFKKRLPNYFLEFLRKVGLKQDFVWGINEDVDDFKDLSDFISSDDYFRFGNNGGEDYWLLKFEDEADRIIYEFDYYNNFEIISLEKTFDDLLLESLEKVKKDDHKLTANEFKDWRVEFNAETESGQNLERELGKYLNVKLIKEPEYVETTPAGVQCFKGEIEIEGQIRKLSKSTYEGWDSPILYFNWAEPVAEMQSASTIKKIQQAFSECPFKHGMTNYGIMKRGLEESE